MAYSDEIISLLTELKAVVEAQQGKIAFLTKAITSHRDKHAALRQCLVDRGVITEMEYLVKLHRRRIAKYVAGYAPEANFKDIVGVRELAVSVASAAGPEAVAAMHATSKRTMPIGVSELLESFRRRPLKLYICGGDGPRGPETSVECFDPSRGVWEAAPPMTMPRSGPVVAALSGNLYIAGGSNGVQVLNSMERFDPRTGQWFPMPQMARPRLNAGAAVIASQLYVCGGSDGTMCLRSAERFNLATCSWETLPPMSTQRLGPGARSVGCQLHVCGGCDGYQRLSSVERFNHGAGVWEALPPMLMRREFPVAAVVGGSLHVCGGTDGVHYLSSVERFDYSIGRWESRPPMLMRRAASAAVVLAGRLLICGGACRGSHHNKEGRLPVNSVERYDLEKEAWEYMPSMSMRRTDAAGAVVAALY